MDKIIETPSFAFAIKIVATNAETFLVGFPKLSSGAWADRSAGNYPYGAPEIGGWPRDIVRHGLRGLGMMPAGLTADQELTYCGQWVSKTRKDSPDMARFKMFIRLLLKSWADFVMRFGRKDATSPSVPTPDDPNAPYLSEEHMLREMFKSTTWAEENGVLVATLP